LLRTEPTTALEASRDDRPHHIDPALDKTLAQREGFACWFCGETRHTMTPIPDLHTVESAKVFRCADRDACDKRGWPATSDHLIDGRECHGELGGLMESPLSAEHSKLGTDRRNATIGGEE
jgi:hypothetical protein